MIVSVCTPDGVKANKYAAFAEDGTATDIRPATAVMASSFFIRPPFIIKRNAFAATFVKEALGITPAVNL